MAINSNENTPGSLYSWYVVFVLMLANTSSFIDRMIMGLLVGPIRETFGISDTQYSLLAGLAFGVFYAVMGLPLARIADAKSRKGLIAIGISLWSAMTAVCGLATGFWSLFLARIGVGVGEASLSPAAYSLIADYFKKEVLARAFSVYTFGIAIGSGLAYLLGGAVVSYMSQFSGHSFPLVGVVQGWQLTFFAVGIPGILVVLLMLTIKEPKRKGVKASKDNKVDQVSIAEVIKFFKQNKKAFASHIFGVSIFIMVVYSINLWGPTYLIRTFSLSPGEAGLKMGLIMLIGSSAGLFTGGYWADHWFASGVKDAYSRVIQYSALMALPFILLLGMDISESLGVFALGCSIFFCSFQGGISAGTLQLMVPNQMRGQATALYFMCANLLGLGIGPTAVAFGNDFIFQSDAAIGKSIALCGLILIPISIFIMRKGLRHVRTAIEQGVNWN